MNALKVIEMIKQKVVLYGPSHPNAKLMSMQDG
jgi:hypothetical protein